MNKPPGLVLLLSAATAMAHFGIGLGEARCGNVFFTETNHVWKITRDGRKSVALAGVHTEVAL